MAAAHRSVDNYRRPWLSSVEILDLRHFSSADLRPLLEQEIEVWGRLLAWDYRGSSDMILRYIDAKILPGYAAVERGSIVGYSFFVYEGSKGVVGDLFVSPRRADARAIELQMAEHMIETLQQSPGILRVEAQLLTHQTGELVANFVSAGFQRYRRLFLALQLRGSGAPHIPPVGLLEDILVRRWADQDYQPAAGVITAAYRSHIDSEINDQYRTNAGSNRFLNNIVRFPGCGVFDQDSSFVAIHRASSALIGLILCSRVKDDVGHVTQVCLVPEYRGRGIGERLVASTYHSLRNRSFRQLSLTVTEANHRAVDLYRRLGFVELRVFDAFVWETVSAEIV
jgi:ribosomal protein S18 acetylase RimI-like enzyme